MVISGVIFGVIALMTGATITSHSLGTAFKHILEGINEFKRGNLAHQIELHRNDELDQVGKALNEMASNRRNTNTQLEQANAILHAILKAAPIPMVAVDTKGDVLLWNPAAERVLGWPASELIGHSYLSVIPDEDRPRFWESLKTPSKVYVSRDVDRIRNDGTRLPMRLWSGAIVANEQNLGRVGIMEDLSEQQRVANETRLMTENERRINRTLETIAFAAISIAEESVIAPRDKLRVLQVIADRARTAAHADTAALGVIQSSDMEKEFSPWVTSGISDEQAGQIGHIPIPSGILGWSIRQGQSLRLADVTENPLFKGFPAHHPIVGPFLSVAIRFESKASAVLFLGRTPEKEPFTEQDQRAIELLGAHAGVIIQNNKLYQDVLEERSRLQLISDTSVRLAENLRFEEIARKIPSLLLPRLGDYCIVNSGVDEGTRTIRPIATGALVPADEVRLQELSSRSYIQLDSEHPLASIFKEPRTISLNESDIQRKSNGHESEYGHVAKNLSARSILLLPLIVRGRVTGSIELLSKHPMFYDESTVSLAEEITRRCAIALDNARLHKDTQRAVHMRDEVLAVVSHDLKNPVAAVRAHAQFLSELDVPQPQKDKIANISSMIIHAANRMLRLISDLLDATALESGKFSVQKENCDFRALILRCVEIAAMEMPEKNLHFETSIAENLPTISCDPGRIEQLLSNLLGNAVKFAPPSTTIAISARAKDDNFVCAISDKGPGIAPQDTSHIFERFWRVKGNREFGTGLGLFIGRGIVEAHNGLIWVNSEVGKGSTFQFSLPLHGSSNMTDDRATKTSRCPPPNPKGQSSGRQEFAPT